MTKFWELFATSVIVQSSITLILVIGIVWMYVSGMDVPQELLFIFNLVLGYWFGAKTQNQIVRTWEARRGK